MMQTEVCNQWHDVPRDVMSRSYSSGYCPGIAPGSLLIPEGVAKLNASRNLNTFNNLVQRYNIFLKATTQNDDFVTTKEKGSQ